MVYQKNFSHTGYESNIAFLMIRNEMFIEYLYPFIVLNATYAGKVWNLSGEWVIRLAYFFPSFKEIPD